jgi:uncharacterized membrane protein SirB2
MENGTHIPAHRTRAVIGALLIASGICLLLLVIRAILTHEVHWGYFAWNLFLAWVPLVLARMFLRRTRSPRAQALVARRSLSRLGHLLPECGVHRDRSRPP